MNLRHLQQHLPWTLPYSTEFETSAAVNSYRRVTHDVLHVMKSLGRVAADCEKADHARPTSEHIAHEVVDLVICALHIAKVLNFDLESHVVRALEMRNGVKIPSECATCGGTGVITAQTPTWSGPVPCPDCEKEEP